MPLPSKFKGYVLLGKDEGFKVGDFYKSGHYPDMEADEFDIHAWCIIHTDIGPTFPGQSFTDRHGRGFVVIRKATKKSGLPVRLVLHKAFATPLPLP